MTSPEAAWAALDEPWRICLDEAWASWRAGCFGIGAAVVAADGSVVATGRNRVAEADKRPGLLSGTMLAHAEMNALANIPLGAGNDLSLYTSLEPCIVCAGAILMLRIPEVHFLGADPIFDGISEHLARHPWAVDRAPEVHGPGTDPVGAFARLLPLTFLVFWMRDEPIVEHYRDFDAELVDLAEALVDGEELAAVARDGGTTADALALLWDRLSGSG